MKLYIYVEIIVLIVRPCTLIVMLYRDVVILYDYACMRHRCDVVVS